METIIREMLKRYILQYGYFRRKKVSADTNATKHQLAKSTLTLRSRPGILVGSTECTGFSLETPPRGIIWADPRNNAINGSDSRDATRKKRFCYTNKFIC